MKCFDYVELICGVGIHPAPLAPTFKFPMFAFSFLITYSMNDMVVPILQILSIVFET